MLYFAMRSLRRHAVCSILTALPCFVITLPADAQSLQITYGSKGVQTLAYRGVMLEDIAAHSADSFHIWHLKATDLKGALSTGPQVGWGEDNSGESWNPTSNTETYTFTWGSIAVRFAQQGDTLDMVVTEANNAQSGIILDGAEIYPFALHFPADPLNFNGYSQYTITTTGPGVSVADFGTGVATSVIPDESQPLYGGWLSAGPGVYTPIMTSTSPDSLATFLPHHDRPVLPGTTFTYTVSLRFTPEGKPVQAADAYASFAHTYPSQMTWTDKRIIGTAYLASSPVGSSDITQPGGFPTNPRRYFNDPNVDVTTSAGLSAFQARMLAQAASTVANARALSSQGVITWDIEGEQFPQDTSYVCSPDQIATVAPEMETLITDPASPFHGQKLDDAYFKIISAAGLRTGVCLRPQSFTLAGNGTASQLFLPTNAAIIANLEEKARFANNRWGTTLFYVDSTVDVNGGTLDPAIFQQLITDLPVFLFIPEESTPRYYAYTAPFYSFIFHTDLGTPATTYNFYPKAFGANLVNDVSAATLATYQPQLAQSVINGDILMGHADFWQSNDPTLVSIYKAANLPTAPTQVTPVVTWPTPSNITFGAPLSATQLNASASALGTFTYAPPAGSILPAGTNSLLASFTPTDTHDYTPATASVSITVLPATPTITWPTPAPLVTPERLSGLQLNASASVPGRFIYHPSLGTVLTVGQHTISAVFCPTDSANYLQANTQITLTVNPSQQSDR